MDCLTSEISAYWDLPNEKGHNHLLIMIFKLMHVHKYTKHFYNQVLVVILSPVGYSHFLPLRAHILT